MTKNATHTRDHTDNRRLETRVERWALLPLAIAFVAGFVLRLAVGVEADFPVCVVVDAIIVGGLIIMVIKPRRAVKAPQAINQPVEKTGEGWDTNYNLLVGASQANHQMEQ